MTVARSDEVERKAVDTSTRYANVYARHELRCSKALDKDRRCSCSPRYYGKVYDPAIGRYRVTKPRVSNLLVAKGMKDDLEVLIRTGTVPDDEQVDDRKGETLTFARAHAEFISDCKAGIARTKKRKVYKTKSIKSLDSGLKRVPEEIRRQPMSEVTRGELQTMVDEFLRGPRPLSAERIATIVNAVRSLYRWAVDRELVVESPAALVRLPVDESSGEHRIATPGEFAQLLDAIPGPDALAWAIAGYTTARHQEIEILDWADVDFDENAILLAGDADAQKSEAARRIALMVSQLRVRMRDEWRRQGGPVSGPVFPPKRADNKSGTADLNATLRRIAKKWKGIGLTPITFQDSRHTAATWLDHAGVSPKVASVIMGHKAPKLNEHPGAAPITLRRYTHVLRGELERAFRQLEEFLAEREAEERHAADHAASAA
jgi:integrase